MKALSILAILVLSLAVLVVQAQQSQPTVDWNDVHQQIDGFGASSAWLGDPTPPVPWSGPMPSNITDAQADMFFSESIGIGLSLLRSQVRPDGTAADAITQKKAVARGARVWAVPWSPPAAWKSNNDVNNGGYLLPAFYSNYANQLAQYVLDRHNDGVDLYAVSIQNEPDWTATYPSSTYTGQQLHDFLPSLYNALAAKGVGSTKILLPEQTGWFANLADIAMNDPNTAPMVGGINVHHGAGSIAPINTWGGPLWQTQWSTGHGSFDPSMLDALTTAQEIHNSLVIGGANAWHYWELLALPWDNDNEGLTDPNGAPAKRMYALGNWSKFVRPGFYRIGATNSGSVLMSAYKDPASGKFAIVAINPAAATTSTFSLLGFNPSSVTPWITSDSFSLSAQPAIAVSGSQFTYNLPANSVVTFVGVATGTDTNPPISNATAGETSSTGTANTNTTSGTNATMTTASTTSFSVNVNFQPQGSTYAGYVADSGLQYGDRGNGYSYGWNYTVAPYVRNSTVSPDQRYDTFALMGNAVWEIAVPNGSYTVHVVVGDATWTDVTSKLTVEGVMAINGNTSSANRWLEATVTVSVNDGKLTVTNLQGSYNKIDFIDISGSSTSGGGGGQISGGNMNINFQPAGSTYPGYVADVGALFADRGNGYSYGWSTDQTTMARARGSSVSQDLRYDTLVHMGSSVWEIAVPNGSYTVHAVVGDPMYYDVVAKLTVEGVLAINGNTSSSAPWLEGTVTVSVNDGRLTVGNQAGSYTKINYIDITPATNNNPPSVGITSPATGATFNAPATIPISATASDNDGTVAKVEFFQGSTKIGEDLDGSDGWSFTWTNVPAGNYSVTARATDNGGAATTSMAVNVTVGDTRAPVISGASASGVTSASATITWSTDEPSDSQVQYGTSTSYGSSTTLNSSMTTSHSQGLSGLAAATTYHYRVLSRDAAGNLATSGDNVFTTASVQGGGVNVNINFQSSGSYPGYLADAGALYSDRGNGYSYGWSTDQTMMARNRGSSLSPDFRYDSLVHMGSSVWEIGLPNGSYTVHVAVGDPMYYDVVSKLTIEGVLAVNGNTSSSSPWLEGGVTVSVNDGRLTVGNQAGSYNKISYIQIVSAGGGGSDTTPPVISAVASTNITTSGATITWTTNEPSDSQVQYGVTQSYGSQTTLNSSLVTSHSQTISGLLANTTYNYRVLSRDSAGNPATSGNFTFTTANSTSRSYSSNFDLTENPISEGGAWSNTGINWTNVATGGGIAYGTQTAPYGYNDSIAVLSGFSPDQSAWGVAYINPLIDQSCNHEVEILLRFATSPTVARGYEINMSWNGGYSEIVRWNGPLGNFTYLARGSFAGFKNGDVLKASIVGSVITVYVNGNPILQATDSTFPTGNPGIGFFHRCGNDSYLGFTSFSATSN